MKKMTFLLAAIMFVIAAGSAFAGDNAKTGKAADNPYNGITFFDLGAVSNDRTTESEASAKNMYNGITHFEFGGVPLQSMAKEPGRPTYNGITIFSQAR